MPPKGYKKSKGGRSKELIWKETREDFVDIQNGLCAICAINIREDPHLDHDHETGKIRGALCQRCNTGLGMFRDSCYILDKAIEYLRFNMVITKVLQ